MQAIADGDVDATMADYTEDSVVMLPDGLFRGLEQIRALFAGMFETMPPGFVDAMETTRQDIEGEVAYIVWSAKPFAPLGTDTFIVRDSKIVVQTAAFYMPPPDA
jgi:ketosteroid isomerase-like protein